MLLCWKLHRKGVSPVPALGIVMAAALVPAWFLVFEQHTIVHAWMTVRLVTPFCGLGMSLVVLAGWALARTLSSRGRRTQPRFFIKQSVFTLENRQVPPHKAIQTNRGIRPRRDGAGPFKLVSASLPRSGMNGCFQTQRMRALQKPPSSVRHRCRAFLLNRSKRGG